jgi:hypothetical protein
VFWRLPVPEWCPLVLKLYFICHLTGNIILFRKFNSKDLVRDYFMCKVERVNNWFQLPRNQQRIVASDDPFPRPREQSSPESTGAKESCRQHL